MDKWLEKFESMASPSWGHMSCNILEITIGLVR